MSNHSKTAIHNILNDKTLEEALLNFLSRSLNVKHFVYTNGLYHAVHSPTGYRAGLMYDSVKKSFVLNPYSAIHGPYDVLEDFDRTPSTHFLSNFQSTFQPKRHFSVIEPPIMYGIESHSPKDFGVRKPWWALWG